MAAKKKPKVQKTRVVCRPLGKLKGAYVEGVYFRKGGHVYDDLGSKVIEALKASEAAAEKSKEPAPRFPTVEPVKGV